MTLRNAVASIGSTVEVADGHGLTFTCRILDVRVAYGQIQAFVTPVTGDGERWIAYTPLTKS
jgi:hypothetical protein